MVICVLLGKLLISASENEDGRAAIPSTVTRQSTKLAACKRLNSSPNGSTSLVNGFFEMSLRENSRALEWRVNSRCAA